MKFGRMQTVGRCLLVAFAMLAAGTAARGEAVTTAATAPASTQPAAPSTAAATTASPAPSHAPADAVAEESGWSQRLNRLALLLAGSDLTALQRALEPSPVIRAFSGDASQTPERLLGTTTGSQILGVHAYEKIPTTLARDLAADFGSAGDAVPQSVRDGMQPRDAAAAKRADETAAQWLTQVLRPEKGEVTGVMVLWPRPRGRSAAAAAAAAPTRATFVLVKARKTDGDDYVLRQITFGDPLETPQ